MKRRVKNRRQLPEHWMRLPEQLLAHIAAEQLPRRGSVQLVAANLVITARSAAKV